MAARLWAEPNPAGGTIFRLPCKVAEHGGAGRWRLMPVVHLIDDDEAVRQALAFLLTASGFRRAGLRIRAVPFSTRCRRCSRAASSPMCGCRGWTGSNCSAS